ncbi:GntR family transcriptional regulator [Chryseosolibacter indicus]|uniref:GntR family transcriptional regulator n=1 Tax=Chryseosolibacter indicus TaxID=2782351 RepID=A0ABS5VYN6_9BACT|nr:GntR family transcriptional regulator [Chryseosolibacter indicus]MBT1705965.1 GntR family transcriptional regulator [Chryseosolibacter indicus]
MVRTTEADIVREIRVNNESRIPKYRQIVNSIIEDIGRGVLHVGQRVPSINEISEEYCLSRDTVEKAYNCLKEKKIIVSAKGKGYYVARTVAPSTHNILFLLNKLSSYKLQIYNSFVTSLGDKAHVDLNVYHCDPKLFLSALEENLESYDYFVVMPHFKDEKMNHQNVNQHILEALRRIPEDKLIILDNFLPGLQRNVASVYQDFRLDIYDALAEGNERLKKYKKLILVFPRKTVYPFPLEILKGFKEFCHKFSYDYDVLEQVYNDMDLQKDDAYIIIEETDLVNLVKQIRDKDLRLGEDIGVVSYNDTPLKELLGITVISTDFKVMGETAAYMILKQKKEQVKNVFNFTNRNSI